MEPFDEYTHQHRPAAERQRYECLCRDRQGNADIRHNSGIRELSRAVRHRNRQRLQSLRFGHGRPSFAGDRLWYQQAQHRRQQSLRNQRFIRRQFDCDAHMGGRKRRVDHLDRCLFQTVPFLLRIDDRLCGKTAQRRQLGSELLQRHLEGKYDQLSRCHAVFDGPLCDGFVLLHQAECHHQRLRSDQIRWTEDSGRKFQRNRIEHQFFDRQPALGYDRI